jgi:alpha-ketoglutarate-dependent 2,4-dichlorophenoxyacetate dioxygenase
MAEGPAVRQLHATIGAEACGANLRSPADPTLAAALRQAWLRHAVLVFPNQPIDDQAQIAFSHCFGQLERTVIAGISTDRLPEIYVLSNVGDDGRLIAPEDPRKTALDYNLLWHTDSSFKAVPSAGAILSAREVTPAGGETEWADMRAAWDALPGTLRAQVDGLSAEHSIRESQPANWARLMDERQRALHPAVAHPIVRTHPETGRRSLYLGAHARRIVGMEEAEGRALLDELLAFATQERFVYRHRWQAGDVVLWDNRCTLHRGRPYDAARFRRIMHRTTLAGDVPPA